jgi:iron complex outermembrane receptor protein
MSLHVQRRHSFIAALLAGSALVSQSAFAADPVQVAAAGDETGLAEIVVTAQKFESNLQQTPISISVLGADALQSRGVNSLTDLGNGSVPSLRIAPFATRSSALTVGIRGIVSGDANQPARDPGVGVYIDGVYLGRPQGLGAGLYDVERIEVLKGPQGTLFGRNSTGGALNIVTRKPTGEFGLTQQIGMGNFGSYISKTHLNLPTFGNISIKIDGVLTKREGTVENPMQGEEDFNSYNRRGIHGAALWDNGGSFTALLHIDSSYDGTTPYYIQLIEKNPTSAPLAPLVQVQRDRARTADIGLPQQLSIGQTHGTSLDLNWQATDAIAVRSISSFRKLSQTQYDNGFGAHSSPFVPNARFARYSLASLRQKQYSQEVQVLGKFSQVSFVTGAYYFHEKVDDDAWTPNTMQWDALGVAPVRLPTLQAGAQVPFPDRGDNADAESMAAFGQATYTPAILNDALHLTLGLRGTHDNKHGTLYKLNGANTNLTFVFKDTRVDPAVTVAYDVTEDVNVYGKWGTAYRSGGANSRSISYRPFGPETVSAFELGLKSEFFDRVRLNAAAYTTAYKNIQIDFNAVNLLSSNRGTLETVNAPGTGRIKGIEADASVLVTSGLTLSASYAYTSTHIPRAANPFNNGALQNVFIVYTPKNAFSGAADYDLPFDTFSLRTHLDFQGGDGYRSNVGEATLTEKSFVVNGRIAAADIDIGHGAAFEVGVWMHNVFNEQHTFYYSRGAYAALGAYGIYNEPRTFGIDATLRF